VVAATMRRAVMRGIMAERKANDRQDRLKAALRENLKRRKSQARGREEAGRPDDPAGAPPGPDIKPPQGKAE
jgi:hypothetical protein